MDKVKRSLGNLIQVGTTRYLVPVFDDTYIQLQDRTATKTSCLLPLYLYWQKIKPKINN